MQPNTREFPLLLLQLASMYVHHYRINLCMALLLIIIDDTNECLGEGICPASSKCANTIGSYICICDAGYFSMSTGSSSDSITCNGKYSADDQASKINGVH